VSRLSLLGLCLKPADESFKRRLGLSDGFLSQIMSRVAVGDVPLVPGKDQRFRTPGSLAPGPGQAQTKASVPMVADPGGLAGPRMVEWFWVAIVVVN
jgi:hypothetical protein